MCRDLCTLWRGRDVIPEFTGFVLPSSLDILEYKKEENFVYQVPHTLHDLLEYGKWVFSKLTLLSQATFLPTPCLQGYLECSL